MIDIETHKIIDMIKSRQEEDVTEWLKTYPNLEIISRDGGIMYKSSSDKAHPKAKQIKDVIVEEGYKGCDSLLRTYLAKIKKEKTKIRQINHVVERTTMISLLYKEIKEVKNITK